MCPRAVLKGHVMIFDPIYYVAVLILDVKVYIKSVRRLKRGKFVFIPDSLFEMPIGIDILISEESPYFSH